MAGPLGFVDELPTGARELLLTRSKRRRFARKEVIFHQEDPGDSLHVLDEGWVAVRVVTAMGEVATLDLLGRGSVFGELALLPPTHGRRSASVIALESSRTLETPADVFEEICNEYPAAVRAVLAVMAGRERRLTQRLVEALYVPVEVRLARRLIDVDLQYSASHGEPSSVPLTQDDLASLAGTTRETANRVLRRLVEEGAISAARGSFRVLDRHALERKARVSGESAAR